MTEAFASAVAAAVGDDPCVVALGGGADSAVLLHAAVSACTPGSVRSVFVDHGLEGSATLRRTATDLANHLGVQQRVVEASVIDGPDLERRARDARYTAIESIVNPDEVVLTGHSADDQAETVLMRLMRGSGAGGLAGIPERRGVWLRPFLGFRRTELRSEATRLGLPFTDDPANTDERFLRSRVRNLLLPEIKANYAEGISEDLVRTAKLMRDDDNLLTVLSDQIPIIEVAGHLALPSSALLAAPEPVASRAIRGVLRRCGDAYPGSFSDVSAVMDVARSGSSAAISGSIRVHKQASAIIFQIGEGDVSEDPLDIDPPGIGRSSAFRWNCDSYLVHLREQPVAVRTSGRFSVLAGGLDTEKIGVRGLVEGDRLDIGVGSTPIAELLRDHGVPSMTRRLWPLITIGGDIAAVHGIRAAAWAQPHEMDKVMIIERKVQL